MSDTARTIARNASRRAAGTSEPATPEVREQLLRSGWSTTQRPGQCARCRTPFYPPQAIKYERTDTPTDEFRADCCPGDDRA